MRRADREITNPAEIEAILRRAVVCRLAMCDQTRPYVVPLCFGYDDGVLYFHSAPEGKKLDLIRTHPDVCFEVDIEAQVIPAAKPCAWSMRYRSVVGWGHASLIEDLEAKRRALAVIMRQYTDRAVPFSEKTLQQTTVIRVEIEHMTGKRSA